MKIWHERLTQVLDTLRLETAEEIVLAGQTFRVEAPAEAVSTPKPEPQAQKPAQPAPLVDTLTNVLYRFVYSRPFHGELPENATEPWKPSPPNQDLLAALSAANGTRERWEHGWSIGQIFPNGQIQAVRGALRRLVWPGQFLSKNGPGAVPRPGTPISLFYAKESTSLQPGFYYLFGETAEEQSHSRGIMRLYWNVSQEGAPALLGALSRRLNTFHVPYRMKCAVANSEYGRTDVAVLYTPKHFTRFVVEMLPDVYPEVAEHLGDDVPFFSRPLAPGLGLAEDPGTHESFGQHRCRLVAQAVWNCFLRSESSTGQQLDEFLKLCPQYNTDPENLHLNAGSLEWYEVSEEIHERAA